MATLTLQKAWKSSELVKEKTLLSSLTEPLRIGPAAVAAGCTRAAYDQASQNSRGWGRGPQSPIYSWGAMKVGDYGEREDQFGSEMRPLVTCPYSRALCTCYQHLTNSVDLKKILQGMEYDWFVSKYVIIMHEILNNTKHKTIYTREQTKANQPACSSPDQKKRRLLCRGFHHQNHHPLFLLNFSDGAVVRTQLLLLRGLSRR